jgi:hypothetical protein
VLFGAIFVQSAEMHLEALIAVQNLAGMRQKDQSLESHKNDLYLMSFYGLEG